MTEPVPLPAPSAQRLDKFTTEKTKPHLKVSSFLYLKTAFPSSTPLIVSRRLTLLLKVAAARHRAAPVFTRSGPMLYRLGLIGQFNITDYLIEMFAVVARLLHFAAGCKAILILKLSGYRIIDTRTTVLLPFTSARILISVLPLSVSRSKR